jgi:phospholipid transport system transporter-binding protein
VNAAQSVTATAVHAAQVTDAAGVPVLEVQAGGGGLLRLTGPLTLATVGGLRARGLRTFERSSGAITVDLGGVTRADSGALALIIDWLAWARATGRALHFANPPAALLALARLSDVEEFVTGVAATAAPAGGASVGE